MRLRTLFALFALGICLATPALAKRMDVTAPDAPRSLPAHGAVDVRWTDPAQFSEIRNSGNRSEARQGDWVVQLAKYLRQRAEKRLSAGERLEVDVTDIQRAGNYEPWRGFNLDRTRVMRDIYPPRLQLTFRRIDRDGAVIAQGERTLADPGYLRSGSGSIDPLRYEKRMIDRWLEREFSTER